MIFTKEGNTTIAFQENIELKVFMENLTKEYSKINKDNIIVNLFSFDAITANDMLEFLQLSNNHRASKKSFVLVTNKVSYDDVPEELCVVPTIQEAKDIIEMEEIERDLDF